MNRQICRKAGEIFLPLLLFILCNECIYLLLEQGKMILEQTGTACGDYVLTHLAGTEVILQGTSVFAAFLFQYKTAVIELGKITERKESRIKLYLLLIFEGAAFAIILNLLFNAVGWTDSQAYSVIRNSQLSAGKGLEIAVFGILTPFAEEMIFRGILFNRMRQYLGAGQTILLSAILFGLYHFNPLQSIYAFCMGLLICWNYNRCRRIAVPFTIHAAANISVILMTMFLH